MKVPHDKIVLAFHRWYPTTLWDTDGMEGRYHGFYNFLGGAFYNGNGYWKIPDDKLSRLEMLCSPHWKTLLKAWKVVNETSST